MYDQTDEILRALCQYFAAAGRPDLVSVLCRASAEVRRIDLPGGYNGYGGPDQVRFILCLKAQDFANVQDKQQLEAVVAEAIAHMMPQFRQELVSVDLSMQLAPAVDWREKAVEWVRSTNANAKGAELTAKKYDVFLSHASEDKPLARDVVERLRAKSVRVWFDEFELTVGDSLRRKIDKGIAESRFGVVILSPHFFKKRWPLDELGALHALTTHDECSILPIWHRLNEKEIMEHSPILAGLKALPTSRYTTEDIVNQLVAKINRAPGYSII